MLIPSFESLDILLQFNHKYPILNVHSDIICVFICCDDDSDITFIIIENVTPNFVLIFMCMSVLENISVLRN
jgi:hypothetical protein